MSKVKTSYFQCNPTCNPSIIRKHIVSDIDVVNSIKNQKNKLKAQNSLYGKEVECETNLSTKVRDFKGRNDEINVVIVETYPEVMEVINVVNK